LLSSAQYRAARATASEELMAKNFDLSARHPELGRK
jgi:hypothetical protein